MLLIIPIRIAEQVRDVHVWLYKLSYRIILFTNTPDTLTIMSKSWSPPFIRLPDRQRARMPPLWTIGDRAVLDHKLKLAPPHYNEHERLDDCAYH